MDALFFKLVTHTADQRVGVAFGQGRQQFEEPPVGLQRGKQRGVLHLTGHDDLGDALLVKDVDEAAEFGDAQPVTGRAELLDFGRRVVLQGQDHHFVAELLRGLECKDWEPSTSGDQTVSHCMLACRIARLT